MRVSIDLDWETQDEIIMSNLIEDYEETMKMLRVSKNDHIIDRDDQSYYIDLKDALEKVIQYYMNADDYTKFKKSQMEKGNV